MTVSILTFQIRIYSFPNDMVGAPDAGSRHVNPFTDNQQRNAEPIRLTRQHQIWEQLLQPPHRQRKLASRT